MAWTIDTLKEHFEQRLADMDKAVAATKEETREYKIQANEWRGTMNDKDDRFALKTETGIMRDDIKKLQLWEAKLSGMATQADIQRLQRENSTIKIIAIVSSIISFLSVVVAIVAML